MNLFQEIAGNKKLKKPVIYGINSYELNKEEIAFFKENLPVGFILFARNIKDKIQLKNLTDSLKDLAGSNIMILIDQEGGRVQRMTHPHWKKYEKAEYFGKIYENSQENAKNAAKKAIFDNFLEISHDLKEVGINVDCVPMLDVRQDDSHDIITCRTLGKNPQQIIDLAQEICRAIKQNGVFPVIKHIPGHGRAICDSHLELPQVDASLKQLSKVDFVPFRALNNEKLAMTAHILYSQIDDEFCATQSKKVIELIRKDIAFENILMTDDLSMKALKGDFSERACLSLNAGCDLILHCNGDMNEMRQINQALPEISDELRQKFAK